MSGAEHVADQTLPSTLSILPLKNRILLPSSAMKLLLTSPRSVALVDAILSSTSAGSGHHHSLYVGVVPTRRDPRANSNAFAAANGMLDDTDDNEDAPHHAGGDHEDERARLHDVGTAARIIQISRKDAPVRSYTLLLEGRCRFGLDKLTAVHPFIVGEVRQLDAAGGSRGDPEQDDPALAAVAASFKDRARELVDRLERRKGHARRLKSMLESAPAHRLADLFVAAFEDSFDARLELLSTTCPKERMRRALSLVEAHLGQLDVTTDIAKRVEGRLSKTQREYLLRQQMQAIREELGETDGAGGEEDDLDQLQRRLHDAAPPDEVLKQATQELRKLRKMTEQAPAYGSTRSWIECVASLPWSKEAAADAHEVAMVEARAVLDEEHYGLDKVKDRIVEYLAVRRLRPEARPPILCFTGPPGVGKTTLARSIAKVLSRPFQRISLGGVRDEADIRGHRRTYIASMPGRLIAGLRRCGVKDPVLLLDELDKMGADSRGDPAAAMLEVLDPEQNRAFTDHYLGVPFDLSRVTFLATANDPRTIPGPLRDRMEMIDVPGYTSEEKHHIAMTHVVPRVLDEHGLLRPKPRLTIPREAVEVVVRSYTREAGVRGLQRCLASLCRAAAVHAAQASDHKAVEGGGGGGGGGGGVVLASPPEGPGFGRGRAGSAGILHPAAAALSRIGPDGVPVVTRELIEKVLGPPRYDGASDDLRSSGLVPGVVAGLSWTAVGGDIMYIEAAVMPGAGSLQLTGQLGDVIKESAHIAMSWVQSHAAALGLTGDSMPFPESGGGGGGAVGGSGGSGGRRRGGGSPPGMYATAASVEAQGGHWPVRGHHGGDGSPGGHGLLRGRNVHIHLPQGAIPKDGPSAGVTMCCALVSLFSGRPVRVDTAMTGEVSLRGLVLPVGGIKEKLIAAHQNGIARVLVPSRNLSDVEHEVPESVRAELKVVPCATMADVLENAFEGGYRLAMPSKL